MEEEKKGLTFKDVCKTIWLRKWVALVVAVVVALVTAIALYYGYNPKSKTCTVEFSFNLPGSYEDAFYSYPDGTLFHYTELTSVETLKAVKASGEFSNVDVEKMVSKRNISVSRTITTNGSASDKNPYREVSYKINANLSYFNGSEQAKDFLVRVANYPKWYLENMEIDYNVYLSLAEKAKESGDNEITVKYLRSQHEFLSAEYKKLIEAYGDTFVVANGKTLLACSEELKAYAVDATDVESSLEKIRTFTDSFRTTSKAVYAKAAVVAFTQPSIIVESGGMGLTKIFLFSVMVAVVIALVAAYVAGYLALKKKKARVEANVTINAEESPAVNAEPSEPEIKE